MSFDRLPESVQVLYAELREQAIHAAAATVAIGPMTGSFVRKKVKGRIYWYLQRMEGDRKRQHYLGPDSEELRAWMGRVREARALQAADGAVLDRLCGMLQAGGALVESRPVAQVLHLLSSSGVFHLGGVLVGTHAFRAHANMLGVRFEQQALRTLDIDIAQEPAIGVTLASGEEPVDVGRERTGSGLGFHAVPGLDPRRPSTSFKVRGRELRVDFLTPLRGPESEKPIFLPAFRVAAQPLRFLDYLIEDPQQAVLVSRSAILVNVPDPARFAFHKLWISQRRPAAEQTKARKDSRQAGQLIEVLLEDRPDDLTTAWRALERRASERRRIARGFQRLDPAVRGGLAELLGEPGLSS